MNITRNNYEEYFLLYADGELNATDKKAVEHFVNLHPDLGEELEMLMEAVLKIPPVIMPGKHLLLKQEEWCEENLTPQQQELFLLLDKELPAERATALQAKMDEDPILQKDWSILQQTKLITALVEMPDKESLYRSEKDRRRPIPITWVKWMAAAAVVAGLGWYSISLWNNREVTIAPTVAGVTDKKTENPAKKNTQILPEASAIKNDSKPATASVNKKDDKRETNPAKVSDETITAVKQGKTENIQQQTIKPIETTEPVYTRTTKQQQLVETIKEAGLPLNTIAAITLKELSNPIANPVNQKSEVEGSIAQQAVYNEDAVDETEYVNIAGAHIKKQKLRGIFRNVTRTVGRTFDKSNVAQADVASLK
ncbi:hypothetical protein BH10BAC3_BH10BAC3_02380 [soil metagenome]